MRALRVALMAGLVAGGIAIVPPKPVAQEQEQEDPEATAEGQEPQQRFPQGPEVRLESVADGLTAPTYITQPDDGTERLFIVDQDGEIRVVSGDGALLEEPFLDLSDRLTELEPDYDERGALGLGFHPSYADNGRFFVYYSAPLRDQARDDWDHTSVLSEFRVSADDPDRADPDSERVMMEIDQPWNNHNAGQILFGADERLYVPLGDGGNGGDVDPEDDDRGRPEDGNAQTTSTLYGSILRLNVDGEEPYEVPEDNPFVDENEVEDEIWVYGLRNPYGVQRDLETGDFYVADAGQALFEEVNRIPPQGGGNYGWNIKEGTHCFNPDDFLEPPEACPDRGERGEELIDPVVEYQRDPEVGSVVVPGVMYRGDDVDELDGRLVFGDYSRIRHIPMGVIYVATPTDEELWPIEEVRVTGAADGRDDGELNRFLLGVGQDLDGNAYALTTESGGPDPDAEAGEVFLLASVDADEGWPWWGWLAVAVGVAVVVVIGAVAWRRARGRGSPDTVEGPG